MTAAQTMLDELASLYAETYALAVVAAMDYASFVEARDNKDVLASTELWARGEIQRYLDMAVKKASNRINNIQV
jgi:hypothetical protein